MCGQIVTLLVLAYCQVPPSSQAQIPRERHQDVRAFKAAELHIQEKTTTLTICSPGGLDFHLVLEDGSVRHHRIDDELSDCQPFKILSGSDQIHIEKGMHRVKTFKNSVMKEAFIKSELKDTLWKFFELCSDGDTGEHLCRVTCPGPELCEEYITCPMDKCSNSNTDTIHLYNLIWFFKAIPPLLLIIVLVGFLVIYLSFNFIERASKTQKYDKVAEV